MRKRMKRILGIVLALVICTGLVPGAVFTASAINYDELPAVEGVTISGNILSWDAFPGAMDYDISVVYRGGDGHYNFGGLVRPGDYGYISETSVDLQKYIASCWSGASYGTPWPSGEYGVTLMAVNRKSSSAPSNPIARWVGEYYYPPTETARIRFDANGGSANSTVMMLADRGYSFLYGEEYTLPECMFRAPTGMKFIGWDWGQPGDVITLNGDCLARALWAENPLPADAKAWIRGNQVLYPGNSVKAAFTNIPGEYGSSVDIQWQKSLNRSDWEDFSPGSNTGDFIIQEELGGWYIRFILTHSMYTGSITSDERYIFRTPGYAGALTGEATIKSGVNAGESLVPTLSGDVASLDESMRTYQWWQSYDNGSTWSRITGATSKTYVTTRSDELHYLKVMVYPASGSGYTGAVESNSCYVDYYTSDEICEVSFDTQGHGPNPDPVYVTFDSTIGPPEQPSDYGYVFKGWYNNPEGTGQQFRFWNAHVQSNLTLYAKWEIAYPHTVYAVVEEGKGTLDLTNYNPIYSEEVTVTATPEPGYYLKSLEFDNGNWNRVDIISDGKFKAPDRVCYVYAKFGYDETTAHTVSIVNNLGSVTAIRVPDGAKLKDAVDDYFAVNGYPTASGYRLWQNGYNLKPHYDSYEEWNEDYNTLQNMTVHAGTTVYIQWEKAIRSAHVALAGPGVGANGSSAVPVFTISEWDNYTVNGQLYNWYEDTALSVVPEQIQADTIYYSFVNLCPKFGFYFDENADVRASDSETVVSSSVYDDYTLVATVGQMSEEIRFTLDPVSQTVNNGEKVTFSAQAEGEGISYQWQYSKDFGETWKDLTAASAKTETYTFKATKANNNWFYRCKATAPNGATGTSAEVLLEVIVGPVITKQPESQTVKAGEKAVFSVVAEGTDLTYQWMYSKDGGSTWNTPTASSAKTANYSFKVTPAHDGWAYKCVITDGYGESDWTYPVVYLMVDLEYPEITKQPEGQTVKAGDTVKMTVEATGDNLTYQWQYSKDNGETWNNPSASSAKTATYSFKATTAHNGWLYRCIITNASGDRESDWSRLYVEEETVEPVTPTSILMHPSGMTVTVGSAAKMAVLATGENLTYQWQYSKDGGSTWKTPTASSAKTATYSFKATTANDGWRYKCIVTGDGGTEESGIAVLTVNPAVPGAPVITLQPYDQIAASGTTVKMMVKATGENLTYQWQYSKDFGGTWKDLSASSAKKATYAFKATEANDYWLYRCIITADGGDNTSYEAQLFIQ